MPAKPDPSAQIEAERAEIDAQITSLERAFDEIVAGSELVSTDDEHDPEGATVAYERAQVSSLLDAARARLTELDEAAARLTAGTYGRCERCDGPIGAGRLEALPATTRCVTCA